MAGPHALTSKYSPAHIDHFVLASIGTWFPFFALLGTFPTLATKLGLASPIWLLPCVHVCHPARCSTFCRQGLVRRRVRSIRLRGIQTPQVVTFRHEAAALRGSSSLVQKLTQILADRGTIDVIEVPGWAFAGQVAEVDNFDA